jgi:hypothetical protein
MNFAWLRYMGLTLFHVSVRCKYGTQGVIQSGHRLLAGIP